MKKPSIKTVCFAIGLFAAGAAMPYLTGCNQASAQTATPGKRLKMIERLQLFGSNTQDLYLVRDSETGKEFLVGTQNGIVPIK